MNREVIYLDNNATTPPAPEVVESMSIALRETFGNPSSTHPVGQRASFALHRARREVAECLGAAPDEILFTSGGTESDNLAIDGVVAASNKQHIVTTTVEHEAVVRAVQRLESRGRRATYVSVNQDGCLDLEAVEQAITDDTAIVSVMLANNETGVVLPIASIGEMCRRRGVPLHCDAVQAVGKIPVNVEALQVDLLSLSAHKFHGPKGVGLLYRRRGVPLAGQIIGGSQEQDLRGGTENVPGIVGLSTALSLVSRDVDRTAAAISRLRDDLENRLQETIPGVRIFGAGQPRLPNTTLVAFEETTAEQVLVGLSEAGICASGGSACHSGSLQPSRILVAMGIEPQLALGAVRLSLSRYTTAPQIDHLLATLSAVIRKARTVSGHSLL